MTRWVLLAFCVTVGWGCGGADADGEVLGEQQQAVVGVHKLGVFHDADQSWWFDLNSNGVWNGEPPDDYKDDTFGGTGDIALSGYAQHSNQSLSCGSNSGQIGVWRPSTRQFFLDLNENQVWNGSAVDRQFDNFMPAQVGFTDQPIIWTKAFQSGAYMYCCGVIGYYRKPNAGGQATFYIDHNNNGVWDGAAIDRQYNWGNATHIAVPLGTTHASYGSRLATFEPSTGKWFVDENRNGLWDGCAPGEPDSCKVFGSPNTKPFAHSNSRARGISEGALRHIDKNYNGEWDAGDATYTFGLATSQAFLF